MSSFALVDPPILWISGPPASGKSTLCAALLARVARGMHLPVDDMREWVVSGRAGPVPWTDETERQYRIAERAACRVAATYQDEGFLVAIDHCRSMGRLDEVIGECLPGRAVAKVCLMPALAVNLERSHTRTTKNFDPHYLDDVIRHTNAAYRVRVPSDWRVIDNSGKSVDDTVIEILDWISRPNPRG